MKRLRDHVKRPERITLTVDGDDIEAYRGETIATAILASHGRALRRSRTGRPRSIFCNMGTCFECVVSVDGVDGIQACMRLAEDGMRIQTAGSG